MNLQQPYVLDKNVPVAMATGTSFFMSDLN